MDGWSWWRVVVLGVAVFLLAGEVLYLWRDPRYVGYDFHTYAAAARVGEQSGWAQIYDQGLVRAAERQLVPYQPTLRFISPPPVAWLAAGLARLPFWLAYSIWAALMFSAVAFALAWSTSYRGLTRLVAVSGAAVAFSGALIVCAALVTARRVRSNAGIAIAVGVLASLLATPYLFENDLCLLGAAGWILWAERPTHFWRASLLAVWVLAATHLILTGVAAPTLGQWPLIELAFFVALVAAAWFGLLDSRPP